MYVCRRCAPRVFTTILYRLLLFVQDDVHAQSTASANVTRALHIRRTHSCSALLLAHVSCNSWGKASLTFSGIAVASRARLAAMT